MSKEIAWSDVPKAIAKSFGSDTDTYFLREDIKNIIELRDQGHSTSSISTLTGYGKDAIEWAIGYAVKHKTRIR